MLESITYRWVNQEEVENETPGEVRYATWWSECDEAIESVESVVLEGARNTQTSCLDHMQILSDPIVHGQVRDWIAEGDS